MKRLSNHEGIKFAISDRICSWRKVLHEQNVKTQELEKKFPWFPIVYRCVLAVLIVGLFISITVWQIDVRTERRATQMAEAAMADYLSQQAEEQARYEAAQLAEANSERAMREQDTELMAKLLAGINGFVENYGYSEGDVRTYAECVINRVINKGNGFPDTISEVILQQSQWVGFSETNQVIDKYYRIASIVVNNYYDGARRPCSDDYCWAELRRDGVWLKNTYDNSRYFSTWRYTA